DHAAMNTAGVEIPWPGLASYTEEQHAQFFGRESETAELLGMIQRETLTVLFARSGLGKTSLIRAGLIPALPAGSYLPVLLRLDYSESALALGEQAKTISLKAAGDAGVEIEHEPGLHSGATLWEFFHATEFWGRRNRLLTPLLIFDQFEEVFTIGANR